MKFSYNWLKEYIPKLPKPKKLAEVLLMRAFEVESIEKKGNDYVLDIKILNRMSDAGGHIGMAHEIGALLDVPNKAHSRQLSDFVRLKHTHPQLLLRELLGDKHGALAASRDFHVMVEDPVLCPRYIMCRIDNVRVGDSPAWLKKHLEPLGVNSINFLVDLANFIMLKIGQPMHIFDADKINGKKIIVRFAKKNERITTLDGALCALDPTMLVIADRKGPLAIAGVKGGNRAAVTKDTKNILIESANFSGASIRKTSRALKIFTDAGMRFSAWLDPNLAEYGMGLLVRWILQEAGGTARGCRDLYPKPQYPRKIMLRLERLEKVLGRKVSEKEFLNIVRRLEFKVHPVASPREEIARLAKKLLGSAYHYGASTQYDAPGRFDCSSFTRYLFRQIGVEIPRMSFEQYFFGIPIPDNTLLPGDLVFSRQGAPRPGVSGDRKEFGHVGIYIGKNRVIHASSKHKKIIEESLAQFKKSAPYRGARRILTQESMLHFVVEVPTMRKDLMIEEDLIEEIGRITGYDLIQPAHFAEAFPLAKENEAVVWREKIRDVFVRAGFFETDLYNFLGEKEIELFSDPKESYWELENPIRPELAYLRRSVVPALVETISRNYQHTSRLQFFSIGNAFLKEKMKPARTASRSTAGGSDLAEAEEARIAGVVWKDSKKKVEEHPFYVAKGVVDALFESAGITDVWFDETETKKYVFMHPYQGAMIKVGDKTVGFIGSLHPNVQISCGIKKGTVAVFEIDFSKFVELAEGEIEYHAPSKYPSVVRDISLLVPEEVRVQEAEDVIENAGGELLWETELFDLFEGEGVGDGKRSMAFHLIFQREDRTLRDEEVNKALEKIISAIESKNWEVRK